jgi:hypothetical protein
VGEPLKRNVRRFAVKIGERLMRIKITCFLTLLIFTVCCSGGGAQNSKTDRVPSGKQIKVNNVEKMNFPNGDAALVMNYETEIPIENKEALRKEVDEIWSVFQKDVEKAEVKSGVIRATHYEGSGMVRSGKGYGFVYVKGDDGNWHLLDDEKEKK